MDKEVRNYILKAQKTELTESLIYLKLAAITKDTHNKGVLLRIAKDEGRHAGIWQRYTGEEVKANKFLAVFYYLIARIFGLTFGLRLMEKGEIRAQVNYRKIGRYVKDAKKIEKDENQHEKELLGLLEEEKLKYIGSIVLGLNDALVELTGALAGLTLAIQNSKIIAMAGLITGIAASLSMATSEYLSSKTEGKKTPLKESIYTGMAYIITVLLLISPYLLIDNLFVSLAFTLAIAIGIIFLFTFYVSIAKDERFKPKFFEMAILSMSVAAISFGIGYLIRYFFGIEI